MFVGNAGRIVGLVDEEMRMVKLIWINFSSTRIRQGEPRLSMSRRESGIASHRPENPVAENDPELGRQFSRLKPAERWQRVIHDPVLTFLRMVDDVTKHPTSSTIGLDLRPCTSHVSHSASGTSSYLLVTDPHPNLSIMM